MIVLYLTATKKMKTLSILVTLLFVAIQGYGQNLVPNPSFEEYDDCPSSDGQVFKAKHWNSYGNSPDYFNSCSPILDVLTPGNVAGYQVPRTGQAYVGAAFYVSNDTTNILIREFIGTRLDTPLTVGKTYYVRFYVSLADSSSFANCAQNRIGAWFSNQSFAVDSFCPEPCLISILMPTNYAHVYTDIISQDMQNWIEISGSFVADSSYQYLVIGNFFSNDSVDIWPLPNSQSAILGSYYFVDDVFVGEEPPMSLEKASSTGIMTYPNPAHDKLYVNATGLKGQLLTLSGQLVLSFSTTKLTEIDVRNIPDGMYLLHYEYEGRFYQQKQLIIH